MQTLNKLFSLSRILTVLLLLTLFAGCSDDEGSTGEPGTLERVFSHKVIQGCWTCHDGNQNGPDLTRENFQQSLVGKSRNDFNWDDILTVMADCGTKTTYVDAGGNANRSSVLNSISQTYNDGTCTSAIGIHEADNAVLSEAALEDFVQWIENGAPAN